jgi:hypothetical protein
MDSKRYIRKPRTAKDKPDNLAVVGEDGDKVIRPRKRAFDDPQQIVCSRCNGSAVIKLTLAPFRNESGELSGGTSIYACALCYQKDGEVIELAKA